MNETASKQQKQQQQQTHKNQQQQKSFLKVISAFKNSNNKNDLSPESLRIATS